MHKCLLLAALMLLPGCAITDRLPVTHSWDRTIEADGAVTNERYSYITYERSTAATDAVTPQEQKSVDTCAPFVPPQPAAMPPVPEISPRDRQDPERVGTILVGHIAQLREYIRNRDKAADDAFLEYRKKCKMVGAVSN